MKVIYPSRARKRPSAPVVVPPQWPTKLPTKIAFVGEAPSDEEIVTRKPFSGPSGRVFNQMLRSANLDRDEYLITNLYDQQPEDNNVALFRADKDRTADALARLGEELARAKPNVIVPLGATALWAFTGYSSIAPFRGAQTPATAVVPGAKLVPTFHPAMVLRQWKYLPVVVGDFIKAERLARSARITYPTKSVLIQPLEAEVRDYLADAVQAPLLSVDIETGWGQITSVQFSPAPFDHGLSVPFFDFRKPSRSYWGSAEIEHRVWQDVRRALAHPVPKLGQNFTYDVYWLLWKMGFRITNVTDDTRLLHKSLFPELPADLAFLGATYTDIGAWKHYGGRYSEDKRDA